MREEKSLFNNIKILLLIKYALFFSAVSYLIIYLLIVYYRIQYPFELEWTEGAIADEVQRIVIGEDIYVAPSIHFVPFLYPPLYFYLSAVASTVFGGGLFPLRLVSFTASLVSFTTIFLIVREETKNWWAALLSIGLFAATFRLTGAWLDIARVDSLFLALSLSFIYFVRGRKSLGYAILTGALVAMAFLTKQTALIICLPIIVYLLRWNWKYALSLLAAATLIVGVTTLILNQVSMGWYTYYVFGLLSQQTEWIPLLFVSMWNDDLLVHLPLAILFAVFFFIGRPDQDYFIRNQWLSILAGALAGTFLTRVKVGGYDNVLLPTYAIISILFGLGLNELFKITNQLQADYRDRAEILIHFACLIQLVMLFYNPFAQIPTNSDLIAGYKLVQFISEVDGDVYLPNHGYLSTLAGKKTYAHQSAIWDVLRGNQQTTGKIMLTEDLKDVIRQQFFDVIILDPETWNYCCRKIDKYYTMDRNVFQDETVFYPVTGQKVRPLYIFLAKRLK